MREWGAQLSLPYSGAGQLVTQLHSLPELPSPQRVPEAGSAGGPGSVPEAGEPRAAAGPVPGAQRLLPDSPQLSSRQLRTRRPLVALSGGGGGRRRQPSGLGSSGLGERPSSLGIWGEGSPASPARDSGIDCIFGPLGPTTRIQSPPRWSHT